LSSTAWNWLPDGALASPDLLGRVDGAVAEWSGRWFKDHRLVRQRLQYASAPASPPAVASTARFSIRATPAAVEVLTGHALDADLSRLEKGESDQTIIDALSEVLLRDLAAALDAVFGMDGASPAAADPSGGVLIELTDEDGRRAVVIETSRAVLAAARLAGLSERTRRGPPLASIGTAVADVPVTLSASVGSATITLPEARRLAVGDVIVLDRPLDQPIDLVSASGGSAVACARLVDTASPRSLRLEAAAGRDRR
jgi:hypothetical protein